MGMLSSGLMSLALELITMALGASTMGELLAFNFLSTSHIARTTDNWLLKSESVLRNRISPLYVSSLGTRAGDSSNRGTAARAKSKRARLEGEPMSMHLCWKKHIGRLYLWSA